MGFDDIARDFISIRKINWQRNWEPFMKKYQCDYVCELGVYKGDNFEEMIKHNPVLAVAVDAWKASEKYPKKNSNYTTQKEFDEQYEYFKGRVADKQFVQIVRDYTVNASKLFPGNYFDFVYIDADHSFEGCYADICAWYPKVKPGKFLVGHDYRRSFGVPVAVDKFVKDNNMRMIFLPPSTWCLIKK